MMRWTPDSQKQVQPFADSTGMCEIGAASRRQPKVGIPSCRTYPPPLWLWNMDNFSIAYKEAKPLSHEQSEEDSWHHIGKTHPRHRSFNLCFSFQRLHYLDAITASLNWSCCPYERSPLSEKNCSTVNYLRASALMEAWKSASKTHFMKFFGITPNCLEYQAQNRDKWHEVVKHGAKVCEIRRNAVTELRRKLRNCIATSAAATTIPCSHCPRLFYTQIGLISHLCTHGCLPQS